MTKTNVFLSWSGERSRRVASALVDWLPRVIQSIRPWTSDEHIFKGDRWFKEIGSNLGSHNVGIICVTPENHKAPWLLFEAGALSNAIGRAKVCPFLLGMLKSELEGPLQQFQATVFERKDVLKLLKSLNSTLGENSIDDAVLKDAFNQRWPDLEKAVSKIAKLPINGDATTVSSVIKAVSQSGLSAPRIGDHACFGAGFESHSLYTTVTSLATKRLYVFGRKNRKLFDKEHADFFISLAERIANGLDFRVLFLDPDAPCHIIKCAHHDDDLGDQIRRSFKNASEALTQANVGIEKHCRLYNAQRTVSMIIVDDAILCSPIKLDKDGRAKPLTKVPFCVVGARSGHGQGLLEMFMSFWSAATPFR